MEDPVDWKQLLDHACELLAGHVFWRMHFHGSISKQHKK